MRALTRRIAALLLPALLLGPAAHVGAQPAPVAGRAQAAAAAMEAGRFDEAAALYRAMLAAAPDEAGLLMNLGMALALGGHDAEAIAPLEQAVRRNPALVPAQLFLGTTRLAMGQAATAIGPLERVVKAQPRDIEARRVLARAYTAAGRAASAVAELRRITELDPALPQAWFALGHAYNALAQEALASFDAETADSPWRRLLVADALAADGRFTDAFALYRDMRARLPQMVSIHDAIARIYEQTGHADWAVAERRKGALGASACAARPALCAFRAGRFRPALVAALAAPDPESRYWRARAATELALQAFARLDTMPDSRERREARGALARAARRYTDAIAEYEAALALAPGDPDLREALGTSLYLARDYERAVATLAPLAATGIEHAALQTIYGDALRQLQRLDEAVAALALAVGLDPRNEQARESLASAYVQQGEHAAAIPLLESLLPADTDGSRHLQLARAYTSAGARDRAAPLLDKARQLQQAAQAAAAATAARAITPP